MQIFIRLKTGKTISMDVLSETNLIDILNWANEEEKYYYEIVRQEPNPYIYKKLMIIENYGNELTVPMRENLDPETRLISLYKNGFIKEVIFLVL